MNVVLNQKNHEMVMAEAPEKLQKNLSAMGCIGIFGFCTFFEKYPIVFIDLRRKELVLATA